MKKIKYQLSILNNTFANKYYRRVYEQVNIATKTSEAERHMQNIPPHRGTTKCGEKHVLFELIISEPYLKRLM